MHGAGSLTRPVHFRLSTADYTRYEQEASQAGVHLSEYIRERLQHSKNVADELAQLRLAVLDWSGNPDLEAISNVPFALSVECLLLLRTLVSPSQLRAIHAEIQRLGLQPWAPSAVSPHASFTAAALS